MIKHINGRYVAAVPLLDTEPLYQLEGALQSAMRTHERVYLQEELKYALFDLRRMLEEFEERQKEREKKKHT